jgi:exopolyphosphatase/pppGpp-phosphohydrolase
MAERARRMKSMHMPTIAAIDAGTNAMRLAIGSLDEDHRIELLENIRIAQATGIDIVAIGGDEEARLIHRAVADRLNLRSKRTILIDIGGGSIRSP